MLGERLGLHGASNLHTRLHCGWLLSLIVGLVINGSVLLVEWLLLRVLLLVSGGNF
jgi:hypothetical protein